jgi:hypothetical protein
MGAIWIFQSKVVVSPEVINAAYVQCRGGDTFFVSYLVSDLFGKAGRTGIVESTLIEIPLPSSDWKKECKGNLPPPEVSPLPQLLRRANNPELKTQLTTSLVYTDGG